MGRTLPAAARARRPVAVVAAALAGAIGLGATSAAGAVPPPRETPAQVVVSGRTSTAKDVRIARTGSGIPRTFSDGRLKNTAGFAWYVSEHYALKTDYPETKARFYLALLELAYPHYAALFDAEPPGIDGKRMAAVYGSSKAALQRALISDGIVWNFRGGGITFESGIRCAYVYPSGSLQYHQRYILLHEAAHLFQMCLAGTVYNTPTWYYEGIADSLGHHVYDSRRRRLTVHVLDKPTTLNFLDKGLRRFRDAPLTAREIHEEGKGSRGQNFLLARFFLGDPDRAQKLRIWRDELLTRPRYDRDRAGGLLGELFGPWGRINAEFEAWRSRLRSTFHYAEWGWEQDADTLWSYGFAEDGKLSRTDVHLLLNEAPAYDPRRMDYPLGDRSPLVGRVERGVPEPSVGCVLDFSRNPGRGRAGIGMGVIEGARKVAGKERAGFLRLLVDVEKRLVIDGADLGMAPKKADLPEAFRRAMAAAGHRVGMTVEVARSALAVTLRAGDVDKGGLAVFRLAAPLTEAQRARLLSRPLAVLARGGYHGVTPYFDDRRQAEPDLAVPAPPNRWRNPGDRQLWMLYRAERRLGPKAPACLRELKRVLLGAAAKGPAAQGKALDAFDRDIGRVLAAVAECGADKEAVGQATMVLGEAISLRGKGTWRPPIRPDGASRPASRPE